MKAYIANNNLTSKVLILIGLALTLLFSFLILATKLNNLLHLDIENKFRLLQVSQTLGFFLFPSLIFAYLGSNSLRSFLFFNKKLDYESLFFVGLISIIVIPGINLINSFNQQITLPDSLRAIETWMRTLEEQAFTAQNILTSVHSNWDYLINIVIIALVPAVSEELFFRGALNSLLRQKINKIVVIWICAIVFSAIHFQFFGFIPRMLLGAMLGYLLVWSDNIIFPITAHFVNNSIAVIFYSAKNAGSRLPDIDNMGTDHTWWIGCLSLLLGILALIALRIRLKKLESKTKTAIFHSKK